MASPVVAAIDTIKTVIIALTPPDRTAVLYAAYNGRGEPDGEFSDRVFWFTVPSRAIPIAERGAALTQIEWLLDMRIRLSANPHSAETLAKAVANEGILLRRAFDKRSTSWGVGVLELIVDDVTITQDQHDAIINFPLRILTEETD